MWIKKAGIAGNRFSRGDGSPYPPRAENPSRYKLPLTAIMVVVGLVLLIACTTLLYGLEPYDPLTLAGAAAMLGAIGALAGWIPARRASRIDPARVPREG